LKIRPFRPPRLTGKSGVEFREGKPAHPAGYGWNNHFGLPAINFVLKSSDFLNFACAALDSKDRWKVDYTNQKGEVEK